MSTDDELFTSSEVLGGFPAKRARLLLFQIESRTAYLMIQSRQTVDLYLTEEIAEQQELAFFEALAQAANHLCARRFAIWNAMPHSGKPSCRQTGSCKQLWLTYWDRSITLHSATFPIFGRQ